MTYLLTCYEKHNHSHLITLLIKYLTLHRIHTTHKVSLTLTHIGLLIVGLLITYAILFIFLLILNLFHLLRFNFLMVVFQLHAKVELYFFQIL